jgi:hypothetical protein
MQRHRGTKQKLLFFFFTLCHFVPLSLKVIGTRRLRLYLCPPVAAEAGFISATGFQIAMRKR